MHGGGVDAQFGLAPGPGDGVGMGVGEAGFQADAILEVGDEGIEFDLHGALQMFAEV